MLDFGSYDIITKYAVSKLISVVLGSKTLFSLNIGCSKRLRYFGIHDFFISYYKNLKPWKTVILLYDLDSKISFPNILGNMCAFLCNCLKFTQKPYFFGIISNFSHDMCVKEDNLIYKTCEVQWDFKLIFLFRY